MRGETLTDIQKNQARLFQSTPLMRGETLVDAGLPELVEISIHSPHARGDFRRAVRSKHLRISIHSPHARGDRSGVHVFPFPGDFNPLPSCEGRRYALNFSG